MGDAALRVDLVRYPEFAGMDRALLRGAVTRLPRLIGAPLESSREEAAALLEFLEREPRDGPQALLFALCSYRNTGKFQLDFDLYSDDDARPLSVWLREKASPENDVILVRMARDLGLDAEATMHAVGALTRPGDQAAVERLTDVALDRCALPRGRFAALLRLDRIGVPPPPRLRDLLYDPHQGLDELAASALMASGDPEAPSLVVEELRRQATSRTRDSTRLQLALRALRRFVVSDADLARRLLAAEKSDLPRLADDLDAWLAAHPSQSDTDFERGRRAYLRGERRAEELAQPSLAALADSDRDFDLGAALLLSDDPEAVGPRRLDELDRLARLVRRKAGDAPTPERWIAALRSELLSSLRIGTEDPRESDLAYVIETRNGNCVGLSSLCLAVGERLGLPLHGVASPQHVFVRWDDGVVRRNIECTLAGIEPTDADYVAGRHGGPIRREDVASGAYLANLTKRGFLAIALGNRAHDLTQLRRRGDALATTEIAIRLAPRTPHPRIYRAYARLLSGDVTGAVEDLRRAESERRSATGEAAWIADLYRRAGLGPDALRVAEAALTVDPNSLQLLVARVRALLSVGRLVEGRIESDRLLAAWPQDDATQCLSIEAAIAAGDDAWWSALERFAPAPRGRRDLHAALAEALLDGVGDRKHDPASARRVLDRVGKARADEDFPSAAWQRAYAWPHQVRRHDDLSERCDRALRADPAGASPR